MPRKTKKRRLHWWLGLFILPLWLGLTVAWFYLTLPDPGRLTNQYPIMRYIPAKKKGDDSSVQVVLTYQTPNNWVHLSAISPMAIGAIVVSEDWAFYQHNGYDFKQIKESVRTNWEAGRYVRGASTITQQVVRNVFLDQEKKLWRKIKEVMLAVECEKYVSKRRILEVYLNIAQWGEGIYGIERAAHFYFNKPAALLTAKEGAFLAMLLPSPTRYAVSYRKHELTDYADHTIDSILTKMVQAGYITPDQASEERGAPLAFEQESS